MLAIEQNPPIDLIIASGVVPYLIQCLGCDELPNLQYEAAWALTNIASGTSEQTSFLVNAGCIPSFVRLLQSNSAELQEQSSWALGNIAGDSTHHRDLVINSGALSLLIPLLSSSIPNLQKNAAWTISNLCRGKPYPDFSIVSTALPVLSHALQGNDEETICDALWAISYLSDDSGVNNERIQTVLNSGCHTRLIQLLMHKSANVKTPALRACGNIVTGDDSQTTIMVNSGLLSALAPLLSHPKKNIRKEACWTLSNITAGNTDQVGTFIESNLTPALIYLLRTGEFEVKKEACWALSNATSSSNPAHLKYLFEQNLIPPLCQILTLRDNKIIKVALEALDNMLKLAQKEDIRTGARNLIAAVIEDCGALDQLEALQEHESDDIFNKTSNMLKDYFGGETVEMDANNTGFVFNANTNTQQFIF